MADQPQGVGSFAAQCRLLTKEVFAGIVRDDLTRGGDPDAQARRYAERGKPDFALAYLLAGALPDDQRREVLAQAYERRAALTEERARDFDRRFHRPFPLLFDAATGDRATARQIRDGKPVRPRASQKLPPA